MEDPNKGTSDEAIGRPAPWREGRYEERGKPVEPSVLPTPEDDAATQDPPSTPVTQKDYKSKR